MIRSIAGVVAGAAVVAGLAMLSSTAGATGAVAGGVRITDTGDAREWSSTDSSIFTVNYSTRDQASRDQALVGQDRELSVQTRDF